MSIEFGCPVCGGTLRVEGDAVGQVVRCGGCLAMLRVPDDASGSPVFPHSSTSPFPGSPDSPAPDILPQTSYPGRKSGPTEEPSQASDHTEEQTRRMRRKKVRRETAPPPGRGPLFWMVIVGGVIGLGSCVMCAGLMPLLKRVNWQQFDSKNGGFAVELPAKPRKDMTMRGLKPNQSFKIEGTHLWNRGEDYGILYRDIDSSRQRDCDNNVAFKLAVNELVASGLQAKGDSTELEKNGFSTREYNFTSSHGGTYSALVLVADTRMYILIVGGQSTQPDGNNVRYFFNSFNVTNEGLIKGEERGRVACLGKLLTENFFKQIGK